jgi:transposase
MLDPEKIATIRRLYFAEHWKIGTIASELGVHRDTVRAATETDPLHKPRRLRPSRLDPYIPFLRETLERYPRLRATQLLEMIRQRGYTGSIQRLRCVVTRLRPAVKEPFLRLVSLPGEQAQVDWAHFGEVLVGRTKRRLSCFVMTLSFSRALFLEFFFDQTQENFFRGHVAAFSFFSGCPRVIVYDNLKSAVLERQGSAVHFHPRLIELCSHYHFQPRPCAPGKGNQKGKVERAIRYVRESFFEATRFTTLDDLNRRAWTWRDQVAHQRPWPDDTKRTVAEVFTEEKPRLLPLPVHPFIAALVRPVKQIKGIWIPFDLNHYSIPPDAAGRRSLTLAASATAVRILDGQDEIVSHRRSYDRDQYVDEAGHEEKLLEHKRRARGQTPSGRLTAAVPEAQAFVQAAFAKGENAGSTTLKLLRLLDDYGARALQAAVIEALERDTPRISSVAYLLERRRRAEGTRALLPVDLSRRPDLADLVVRPHQPETYDELSRSDDDDKES